MYVLNAELAQSEVYIFGACRSSDCGMKNESSLSWKSSDVVKLFSQYVPHISSTNDCIIV